MERLSAEDLSILVVEPSKMQRKVLLEALTKEGVDKTAVCGNKAEAIQKLREFKPDLVISSLYFEDGTGLELLRLIRAEESLEDLPFMLVSSESRREQLEEFKQSGVIAILPKPFNVQNLNQAINATLDMLSEQNLDLELYDIDLLRVLVVDDSRMARNVIVRVLTNLGIKNIVQAADGSEAIAYLQDQGVDLVVTDYNMPEVNGVELTEFVRKSPTHGHVPVLMVTSESNDAHLQNVAQSGVNAMTDKPFEPHVVKQLLASILEG